MEGRRLWFTNDEWICVRYANDYRAQVDDHQVVLNHAVAEPAEVGLVGVRIGPQ